MIYRVVLVLLIVLSPRIALAQGANPLTVEQCISILMGLSSLNYAGQQLNDASRPPDGSKQYKLGPARMTIAEDISALQPVFAAAQKAQQGFVAELPALPPAIPGKQDSPERIDAAQAQNKSATANWQKVIAKPCEVSPGHLQYSELNIGDGVDQNQFPPNVLGALIPIIDGFKK